MYNTLLCEQVAGCYRMLDTFMPELSAILTLIGFCYKCTIRQA